MKRVNAVRPCLFWPLVCGLAACFQFQSARLCAQPGAEDPSFVPGFVPNGLVYALALQTNGNIVVSGDFIVRGMLPRIARLLPSGALDGSFNIGDGANATIRAIAVQPDQRILAGGSFTRFNGTNRLYLARLLSDGTVDTSFEPESYFSFVNVIALQPDGKILVGGSSGLYRLLPNGKVDPSFAATLHGFAVTVLALLPDGSILANGDFPDAHRLKRLNPDGSLDSNFVVQVSIVDALAVQPDSKFMIAGKFDANSTLVRRFFNDGTPDPSFAPATLRSSDGYSASSSARSMLSLPSGKTLVAGDFYYVNGLTRAGIARLNPDGTLDSDFDTITGFDTSIYALGLQSDGKLLVGGDFRPALEGTIQADKPLVRLRLDSDSNSPGRIEFSELQLTVDEGQGEVTVAVQRTGGSAGVVSAEFYVKAPAYYGSAAPNEDYVPVSGTLVFNSGQTNHSFTVPIIDDNTLEATQSFFVGLRNLTGGAILGSQYQAEIVIADDDAALEFAQGQFYGLEGEPDLSVNVVRRGATNSIVGVDYVVSGGSAVAESDFEPTSGSLTFGPGETNKTFLIPLIDNDFPELAENATIVLRNVVGKASLGSISNAVLTIYDDDSTGSLDPRFAPEITNFVNLAVPLPHGGNLVATHFEFYPGTIKPRLLQFSTNGTLQREFDNSLFIPGRWIGLMAVQADGRVLVSTPLANDVSLLRFKQDGTLDPTFQPRGLGDISHVIIQADGKVLVTGSQSIVTRLTPNGSVDPSFALSPSENNSAVTAMALQADGKILVARKLYTVSSNSFFRLNTDGSVDTSFATDVAQALDRFSEIEDILIESDGNILLIGGFRVEGGRSAKLLRRTDRFGRFTSDFPVGLPPSEPSRMIDGGGKILVATFPGSLFRLKPDLSVDETFVPVQLRQVRWAPLFDSGSLSLEPDGHILVAGAFDAVNDIPRPGVARIKNGESSAAGMVEFTMRATLLTEKATTITIGVRRSGGTNGLVSVNYGAAEGTASAGSDFVPKTGVITFADGEAGEKFLTFDVLDDHAGEGDETFQLMLANPLGGVTLGWSAACDVTIYDNDTTVAFASGSIKAFETSGTLAIPIIRSGVVREHTRVTVEAQSGTAKAGEDFALAVTTIDFAPGETNKIIEVFVVDDLIPEPDETGYIRIVRVTGGEVTPGGESVTIKILDDERPGSVDGGFQQPEFGWWANGSWVRAIALQTDGKILVGGHQTSVNGETALGIVRLLADGTRDGSFQFNYRGFEMPVTALALQPDGKILFVYRQPFSGQYLGRLDANGTEDLTCGASVDQSINALQVLPNGKIVIGGLFASVNGVPRSSIARLLADGSVDAAFGLGAGVRNGANAGTVNALARQSDGKWLIGGQFTSVDGVRRTNVARLYSNGSVDTSFNAGVLAGRDSGSYVAALAIQPNGKVLVGGHFDPSPFTTSRNMMRLLTNGALDVNFNYGGRGTDLIDQSEISKILIQRDSRILVSGHFGKFNQTARNSLARLLWNGTLDPSFDPTVWDIPVRIFDMLIQPNDEILAAGDFDDYGLPTTGVARINPGIMDFKFYNLRRPPGEAPSFRFQVPPGTIYDLQRSPDLVQWRSILLISNQTQWIDANADAAPKRFYRAVRTAP